LTAALHGSRERLVLEGDPGAGKSVALRWDPREGKRPGRHACPIGDQAYVPSPRSRGDALTVWDQAGTVWGSTATISDDPRGASNRT